MAASAAAPAKEGTLYLHRGCTPGTPLFSGPQRPFQTGSRPSAKAFAPSS